MGYASDLQAQLTRQTWDDFKKTYQPWAQELLNESSYMNPAGVQADVTSALGRVNTAFDTANLNQQGALASYGVALTPEQQAERQRVGNIDRSIAVVDAANRIRQKIADRDRALALGLPNTGKSYGLRTDGGLS